MEPVVARPRGALSLEAGEGIELRPVSLADAHLLYAAVERNRARLREWLPWVALSYGMDDLVRHLEERERENSARESLSSHIWSGGQLCGAISLHRIDKTHRNTSVGYWL